MILGEILPAKEVRSLRLPEEGKGADHLTRTVKSGSEIDSPRQTGHRPGLFGLSRFRNT